MCQKEQTTEQQQKALEIYSKMVSNGYNGTLIDFKKSFSCMATCEKPCKRGEKANNELKSYGIDLSAPTGPTA